jgi:hypothetical protein
LSGSFGHAAERGNLGEGKATEESQVDEFSEGGFERGELVERMIQLLEIG